MHVKREEEGAGRGCTQFVHDRSCMAIDPVSILCWDGTRRVFTRQTLLAPSAKGRKVFGESHDGRTASFQHPLVRRTSAPCAYFLAYGDR